MATGKVKWFNAEKGFGFIIPDDGGADMFAHINDCGRVLTEGEHVQYDIGQGRKGPCATNVKMI